MKQLAVFSDSRLLTACVYCGGPPETRDHVPSKVLLDDPLPENLPVVDACSQCNQRFSQDEEYLACLLDVMITGSTVVSSSMRPKIQRILTDRASLTARIATQRIAASTHLLWEPESERVKTVVMKLAQGHAAYERSAPDLGSTDHVLIIPISLMTDSEREEFERIPSASFWPEVGSRAFQRVALGWPDEGSGWIDVQPGRYRYLTSTHGGVTVRIVLSEYLACEVNWNDRS
jgi:hypothetical protein